MNDQEEIVAAVGEFTEAVDAKLGELRRAVRDYCAGRGAAPPSDRLPLAKMLLEQPGRWPVEIGFHHDKGGRSLLENPAQVRKMLNMYASTPTLLDQYFGPAAVLVGRGDGAA